VRLHAEARSSGGTLRGKELQLPDLLRQGVTATLSSDIFGIYVQCVQLDSYHVIDGGYTNTGKKGYF